MVSARTVERATTLSPRVIERRLRRSRSRQLAACYYLDEACRESGATALILATEGEILAHAGSATPELVAFGVGLGKTPSDDVVVHALREVGETARLVIAGARGYPLRQLRRDLLRIFA